MTAGGALGRICVTGPESTGKTTLAARLAQRLNTAWSPEASRACAERKSTPLDASDVAPIARAQLSGEVAAEEAARALGATVVVRDTDLLSTVVYAEYYYGAVPHEVRRTAVERRADLYLLCDVDVAWVSDGVRDSPDQRDAMLARFQRVLADAGVAAVPVRGDWAARWTIASAAADAMAVRLRR